MSKKNIRINLKNFLLTFFDNEPQEIKNQHFEREKEVNGFILVKYFHGEPVNEFNVMIFTKESRKKIKQARELFS